MKAILIVNVLTTLMMAGAILIVQIVHYPLFNRVGAENFTAYADGHTALITLVVGPLMLAEAGTALLLVMSRPAALPAWSVMLGLILIGVVWASTFFLQVPQHGILSLGFDESAYQALVATNWIRTIAWLLRAGLVSWWLWMLI